MIQSIAIIGAGMAGARAAYTLRQEGYDGRITLIGEEQLLPYERPPLSKELLKEGAALPSSFFIFPKDFYAENRIDLMLGQRAEKIDRQGGSVLLSSGDRVDAERFILCTGGGPRRLTLAGSGAKNIHYMRTRGDSERLAPEFRPGQRIIIIGMGIIGAEIAAAARGQGCQVDAIEPQSMPMMRSFGSWMGGLLARKHADEGVRLHLGVSPVEFVTEGGRVVAVVLDSGEKLDCDAIVVGIGIEPQVELAQRAGVAIDNGILVDEHGRTNQPDIFAAGDVTNQPDFFGGRRRLESFQNAGAQAAIAASAAIDRLQGQLKPDWFWTEQFDFSIQAAGRFAEDSQRVIRGRVSEASFTAFFLNQSVLEGVITVNRPRDMGVCRRLIERRTDVCPDRLVDENIKLNALLQPISRCG